MQMNKLKNYKNEIEQFAFEELERFYTGDKPVVFERLNTSGTGDEFVIDHTEKSYVIRGNTSRALLYGVYKLIEKVEGLVFLDLEKEKKSVFKGWQIRMKEYRNSVVVGMCLKQSMTSLF